MKELVLLNHNKNDLLKLKNELEDIHKKVTLYDIEHGRDIETDPIEKPALFICRTETDSDTIVDDALKIASENGSPILFILSKPDECSYDRLASIEMAWYIKEPYTMNELKSRIKETTSSAKICEWNSQLINDPVNDILFSMGATGKILYVSPSVENITGFTQEETLDKGLKELVTEESFTFISGLVGTFCSKLKKGEPVKAPVFDVEIPHKNGSTLWVEISINPIFDNDKNFRYFTGTMHDVTERKRIEERFRVAAECINDQIYEWDMKSDHLKWFGDIEKALGYEKGELPHTLDGWADRVHPDDLPEVMKSIERYKESGDSFEAEYRVFTKNGEIRHWKEHGIPIIDEMTKEVVRTIGVCSDITEKIEAENDLKERDEMFRLIAENANDVIWVLDARGEVVYVSPSLEKLRGFTPEELNGLSMEKRFTLESAKLVRKTWNSFFEQFEPGVVPDITRILELEQPCKDGSTVWTEMHINPVLHPDGNFKFFLGVSRDISERKKNSIELEKQTKMLDTIFNLTPIPMVLVNKEGLVENINQACTDITNVSKENAVGLRTGNVFSCVNAYEGEGCGRNKECKSCIFHEIQDETFRTKKSIYKREGSTKVRLPDGSDLDLNVLVSTAYIDLYDEEAKIIFSVEDITDRKESEKANLISKMQAEEANRTKSEFLATMSHELRTPLNAIIGYSQMLQEEAFGELNPKQNKFTKHIHTSGKHLLDLINDILDLSKIEAGKMELHYEQFNVNDVMKNVYNIIIPLAEKKDIEIDFLISEDITIYADKVRFKQILYNLMSNAVKFTPDNGHVTIEATIEENDLRVSVIDNGIGMSAKEQEKLFTPFYQADSSIARKYQGTGLGLSIVKQMIQLHNGKIEVESEDGKGSNFTFTLPVKDTN
ncbi:PAS domain-containing sensor histidine kinase [Methanolobus profundi]|uniref:histidine kinase n=1 Tax=Methanolobus profundi TaxID=487685 RepID=A0A1I4NT78_9EURY|nr:PAS domain S-box protein [Methanolobus profundi]SFM18701.1 PAS domain S-box-containing protein [Methanolobus profundi]